MGRSRPVGAMRLTTNTSGGGDEVLGCCYGGMNGSSPDSRNRQPGEKTSGLDEGLVLGGREEVQRVVETSCA